MNTKHTFFWCSQSYGSTPSTSVLIHLRQACEESFCDESESQTPWTRRFRWRLQFFVADDMGLSTGFDFNRNRIHLPTATGRRWQGRPAFDNYLVDRAFPPYPHRCRRYWTAFILSADSFGLMDGRNGTIPHETRPII